MCVYWVGVGLCVCVSVCLCVGLGLGCIYVHVSNNRNVKSHMLFRLNLHELNVWTFIFLP